MTSVIVLCAVEQQDLPMSWGRLSRLPSLNVQILRVMTTKPARIWGYFLESLVFLASIGCIGDLKRTRLCRLRR